MLSKDKNDMAKLFKEQHEKVIPKGYYCYEGLCRMPDDPMKLKIKGECPYYDRDNEKPEQYNGYCWFLMKGDWELNGEKKWENSKTGKVQTGDEMGIPTSLIWDQCKECGINLDED